MRKITLLFVTLVLFAIAGPAAADCISCNEPCTGPYGNNYLCNNDGNGQYGGCSDRPNCRGCMGWYNQSCWMIADAELAPEPVTPLLGVQHVTAVVVRHDPTPVVQPQPVQIARAR